MKVPSFVNGDESVDDDETSSVGSATTDKTSRSGTPTGKTKKSKRGRQKLNNKPMKLQYKFSCCYKEELGAPLFGVQFNSIVKDPLVFATVGSCRVSIYQCLDNGKFNLLQCYTDPDIDEIYYTCAWSVSPEDGLPILAVAGSRGVIRMLDIAHYQCSKVFTGHGSAVNEIKFHPKDTNLMLSMSKDHSLRLWNIKTDTCVAIFGGVEGHRDEVLSADFDTNGDKIISSGMDHSLKLWILNRPDIQAKIKESYEVNVDPKAPKPFSAIKKHYPVFSTRDIHRNYVDCVRWFGEFVLSKSCENSAIFWKPGRLEDTELKINDNIVTIIHKLEFKHSEIWFLKFSMDAAQKILACGTQTGKLYVWDLDVNEPSAIRSLTLTHNRCTTAIRQTTLSPDGSVLICSCDNGTIWRWDRVNPS